MTENTGYRRGSDVLLTKLRALGKFPTTYSLVRPGTGPGRIEGLGFKTKAEAKIWAERWGHKIVGEQTL